MTQRYTKGHKVEMRRRKKTQRLAGALAMVRSGVSVSDAAATTKISKQKLEKALRIDDKHLEEGSYMTEQSGGIYSAEPTDLGNTGLPYGSREAEQLVATRLTELEASGRPADRQTVLRELANSGTIKTNLTTEEAQAARQQDAAPAPALAEHHDQGLINLVEEPPATRELTERVHREAREYGLPARHAMGLVWLEEGGEQNNYPGGTWAAVAARLARGA